jgi:hypothetical protein
VASKSQVEWLRRVPILWEKERVCDVSICSEGGHLPFIDQGEGDLHACCTVQLHVEGWCKAPVSWRSSWWSLPRSCRRGVSHT